MKELLDKEVIIIDGEEYVKVLNPRTSEKGDEPKYLYVPVDEYLSKKELFTTTTIQKLEAKKESSTSSMGPFPMVSDNNVSYPPSSILRPLELKKKIMIAHFDDRTTVPDELFGDWIAEKLIKELNRRSQRILFVDFQSIKEFLELKGVKLKDLETPKVLQLLNEVFGIHALVVGQLSGPYVFTTKASKDQPETALALLKIEAKLIDVLSGKVLKTLSTNNQLTATKEKGSFSEEKAKIKAIDLAILDLSRSLSTELENLDWFCRVAKVDGEEIYINAGKLTGIKVGDVMEVFQPGETAMSKEGKGKIQISSWFGIDASIGKMIQGKKPDINDILKITQ